MKKSRFSGSQIIAVLKQAEAGNRSAVATLVERSSRLVLLAKMPDASAAEALTSMFNRIPEPALRQTLTYDQGREMSRHKELTARTGIC